MTDEIFALAERNREPQMVTNARGEIVLEPASVELATFRSYDYHGDQSKTWQEQMSYHYSVQLTTEGKFEITKRVHTERESSTISPWYLDDGWRDLDPLALTSLDDITRLFDFSAYSSWESGHDGGHSDFLEPGSNPVIERPNISKHLRRTHEKGYGLLERLQAAFTPEGLKQRARAVEEARAEEAARRQREHDAEVHQQKVERKDRATKRRRADFWAVAIGVILAVTVLVPWLLGRFVFRDTPLLPTSSVVPDEVRDVLRSQDGSYFGAEYLTGLSVIAFVVALFILVRFPWAGRALSIVTAFALLIGCGYTYYHANEAWHTQEAHISAAKVYPFPESARNGAKYTSCGMSDVLEVEGANYYAWSASIKGTPRSDDCNRIIIYQDWDRLTSVDFNAVTYTDSEGEQQVGVTNLDGGNLCSTDGTLAGLIWYDDIGHWDRDAMYFHVADQAITFVPVDTFRANFPTCTA